MEANFWHQKWARGDIAFHENEANALLTGHFEKLNLVKGGRIFLPLCGKTRDFSWLLANGYRVVGAELSPLAISELFKEIGLEPEISSVGKLTRYSADNIDIFVGDIFDLTGEILGHVDAVYDRAALVALPEKTRDRYAKHLLNITAAAAQLLICIEYDQNLMDGPPFSVNADEVNRHYQDTYKVTLLATRPIPGGLKGKCPAFENLWLLKAG